MPLPLAHAPDELDPYLLALCPDIVASGVDLAVAAEDEMYKLFLYRLGDRGAALASYFSSGSRLWETFRGALTWRSGALDRVGTLLDFASGYGRVTRFIARDLPPSRLAAAEIDPAAVRFQEERFGVRGLVSTGDPDAFPCAARFDAVLVSSLFTHLPERTFGRWLARLWALVAPGGLLAFSVHDPSLRGAAAPAAGDGFLFEPVSESGSLAPADYGTTWVAETAVRRALAAAAPGAGVHRIPRALCNHQDLYLAVDGPAPDPAGLAELGGRPEGFLESCRQFAPGRLALSGWAVDRVTGEPPVEVRAAADGAVRARCRTLAPRPDIAALYPLERVAPVGWNLVLDFDPSVPAAATPLRVEAADAAGRSAPLWEGSVEAALLRAARLDLLATEAAKAAAAGEVATLRARLAAMEASRFWKLRDRWFAVKRALRLTDER